MRRDVRSTRRLAGVAAIAGLAALAALFATASAPAAHFGGASTQAGHKCLVMTGSGDPAFVKNFNPYTATGLPSGAFVRGAFYEPLIISSVAGGGHTVSVARAELEVEQRQQDAHAEPREEREVDATASRSPRPTSSTASRPASRTSRWTWSASPAPDSNIKSVKASGPYKVVINAQDGRLAVHRREPQRAVRRPAAHLVEGAESVDVHEPEPGRLGPVRRRSARFTTQDYVFSKNPHYWQAGRAEDLLPRVRAGGRRTTPRCSLIQSGQVDWTHNFVPNVAQAYSAKDPAHFHSFYATTAYPQSLVFDDTQYPYSIVAFRKALSLAINRNDVSKLGEYGYAPPTDALGLDGTLPAVGDERGGQGDREGRCDLQPDGGEEDAHRRRLHVQGLDADRPEGQSGQRSTST